MRYRIYQWISWITILDRDFIFNQANYLSTITRPQSPGELICPDAPIKNKIDCDGCRLFLHCNGGENQAAHMNDYGCIDYVIKIFNLKLQCNYLQRMNYEYK